jgi:hypothetical protein
MRVSIVASSAVALAVIAGSASANGLIRSNGLNPNHSALSIGQGAFGMSSYTLGNANPSLATAPFASPTGGDAALYTDVVSPYSATANYQSNFGTTTTTSQLSAFKWFIRGNSAAGGTRDVVGAGTFGSVSSQTYVGNTSVITYNNYGTGNWRGNVKITTSISESGGNGRVNVYSKLEFTRIGGLFNDASNYDLQVGSLIDLDVGSNGGTSDTVTNVSGAGERRFKYTDSSGVVGYTAAKGGTELSSLVASRSTVGSTTNLDGSSASLANTIGAAGDLTTGFLWNQSSVGAVGNTVAFEVAFSIGMDAVIPTPGALALLGLSGLVATRRRR